MNFKNVITTVDTHTEGEPTRVVLSGLPPIVGDTMARKKEYMQENLDHYRTALIYEPRGHRDMFGAVLVPAISKESDYGIIFMDHGGYLGMCGHGTIGVASAIYQLGMVTKSSDAIDLMFDTPSGIVKTVLYLDEDRDLKEIHLINVPSFLYKSDVIIDIPEIGSVTVDISYGGNFFALVSANSIGMPISKVYLEDFIKLGLLIKNEVNNKIIITHPLTKKRSYVDLVEFYVEDFSNIPKKSYNVVVFGDGQFDRSPCGTGTSAVMAMLYAKGRLLPDELFVNYGILNTSFKGRIFKEIKIGNYHGIVPEIIGNAFVTGMHQFFIDPDDPFKYGIFL